ncbi:MAG: hypothetical protein QGG71_11820 [Pirellulaceae bacterium]|jgi:hypothetical protein|nr:hypothetical protein [Pirellulaceae bacterium]
MTPSNLKDTQAFFVEIRYPRSYCFSAQDTYFRSLGTNWETDFKFEHREDLFRFDLGSLSEVERFWDQAMDSIKNSENPEQCSIRLYSGEITFDATGVTAPRAEPLLP